MLNLKTMKNKVLTVNYASYAFKYHFLSIICVCDGNYQPYTRRLLYYEKNVSKI